MEKFEVPVSLVELSLDAEKKIPEFGCRREAKPFSLVIHIS